MTKQNKGRKLFATTATAALVASAIVPVASAAVLNDINSVPAWAKDAVQKLADNGVLEGDTKGNFNPNGVVTRAQAAQVFYKALGLQATGGENFADVDSDDWWYDAVVATSPELFQGDGTGKFLPKAQLTRAEAAKVIVAAYGLTGSADLSTFSDASSVKAWAKDSLSTAVASGVINGKGTKLAPNDSITRAEFATMVARASEAAVAPGVESVTAINNTTVEVDFKDAIEDINTIGFAIEGLTVTNAVVKQTDSSVAVLTTSAQEGGKEYTVTNAGTKLGTFKGVSAVLPTEIKTTVASQQGIIGKEVTVSAEVTVASGQSKAGIPVTFNIVNNEDENKTIEVEAITNAEGIASYSYTRYYDGIDSVTAYATSKSSVFAEAKVYWESALQLEVKEVKEGNSLADGAKKVYNVTGDKNDVVFVAFKENLDVRSNNVTDVTVTNAVGYYDEDGKFTASKEVTPYELTNGDAKYVAIQLDKDGKGSFTLTGEDASVTPIVYKAEYTLDNNDNLINDKDKSADDGQYSATALQAVAPTVKWSQADTLSLKVEAQGSEDAAEAKSLTKVLDGTLDSGDDLNLGGRKYTATVTDKNGKLAPKGSKAYVTFEDNFDENVYVIIDKKVEKVVEDKVYTITVDKDGEASFRVIAQGDKAYATPTVFLNTEGSTTDPKLDKKDVQVEADTTYFTDAEVEEATLKVLDKAKEEVTSVAAGQEVTVVYQSVDQNGFPYADNKSYDVTFELSTTFGELDVDGETKLQNNGRTYTYTTKSNTDGKATVTFTALSATDVNISISGANGVLPVKDAQVTFTRYASSDSVTGLVRSYNLKDNNLTLVDKDGKEYNYSYSTSSLFVNNVGTVADLSIEEFEALLEQTGAELITVVKVGDNYRFTVKSTGETLPTLTGLVATTADTNNLAGQFSGGIKYTASTGSTVEIYLDDVLKSTVSGTGSEATATVAGAITGNADIKVVVSEGTYSVSDTITVADNTAGQGAVDNAAQALKDINDAAKSTSPTAWDNITPATFTTAGVTGVTSTNLTEVAEDLKAARPTNGGDFTVAKIQAIVNAIVAEAANAEITAAKDAIGTTYEFPNTADLTQDNSAELKTALDTKVNNSDITLAVSKTNDTTYSVVISHADGGTNQTVTVTVSKAS